MKKMIYILPAIFFITRLNAQFSGTLHVPASYTSVAAVISAINQHGVSGPLTVNIAAGYTETVIYGGYSLTATGSATSPILFQRSGAGSNPVLIAYSGGTGTPGSMRQDGVWRLIGCDYITIDGIDIADYNVSNPSTMEFGYGLFKASDTDGCQHNIIKNCVISLNRTNNANGSGPASAGSRAIDVVNASTSVHNASIAVSALSGRHAYNKFYANTLQNCNIGISLIGFADNAPYTFSDVGNDVGGNSPLTGNTIVNFGGGGSANAAAAIRTVAQHDLNIGFNVINSNTGSGINHPALLRGIQLNAASGANVSVINNTLTLHGGATSSQLTVIETAGASASSSNTVTIRNNLIVNCTYSTSISGPFYGIWNTASASVLSITSNSFVNNSTSALSGSTYLIYNNGSVTSAVYMSHNQLSFSYRGSAAYTGNMYNIYNANGSPLASLIISYNNFSDYNHFVNAGTGNIFFVYNTSDFYAVSFENNTWTNLSLHHTGTEYLLYNNSSTTALLSVNNNSITGSFRRMASAGAMYLCYFTGNSSATCGQVFSGNKFSDITAEVSGTGVFYGIYNTDGQVNSYPKKVIFNNSVSNIAIRGTGAFYGYYFDKLGQDSLSASSVFSNTLFTISRQGVIYGMYFTGNLSQNHATEVYDNTIQGLSSFGTSSNLYSAYLTGGGFGLSFFRNKIADIIQSGTSGVAHGVFVTNALNITLLNNRIGNISAPNSSANNAVNGIYVNSGALITICYNTVYLNAGSTGGNFNSNALYTSSTTSLSLRNNILVNLSSGGLGVAAAYRRSSTSLLNYSIQSDNNLFYAGAPAPNRVILQSGVTGYQTLAAFQTAVFPRDAASVTQSVSFLSTAAVSPNFLRITSNVLSPIESGAATIPGILNDYDGDVRQGNPGYMGTGTAPDIGADEYDEDVAPCSSVAGGTVSAATTTLCSGEAVVLFSGGYTSGTGVSHQWKMSHVSGGSYTHVAGGSGANTPEYISSPLTAGVYYFVLETACAAFSVPVISTPITITVHPVPSVSATVASSLVCYGESIQLLGIGSHGDTYQWAGPQGFNSTLQHPVLSPVNLGATGNYSLALSNAACSSSVFSVYVEVTGVTLSLSATSTTFCAGQSAILTLHTPASSYTWSTGSNATSVVVSPSVETIYMVSVTSQEGCTASASLTLGVITPSISSNNTVVCGSSGHVTLSVNAFTPSVISWFGDSFSNNSIGNGSEYLIHVNTSTVLYAQAADASNGCSSVRIPVTVILSPHPVLFVSANPSVICPGHASTLTASGAATYSWVNVGGGGTRMATPLVNTTYTVTGTDSLGCSSTEMVSVHVHPVPVISAVQTASSVCPSSVVGFTASGADTYFWNTGAHGAVNSVTPAINTTYTVYGMNAEGCSSTKTLAVVTRSVPVIRIVQSTAEVCAGEQVTFTAKGASSYTWIPGQVVSATFSASPVVTSLYNVIGKSINTCTNLAFAQVTVNLCTRLAEHEAWQGSIAVFPNPVEDELRLQFDFPGEKQIRLFSANGALLFDFYTSGRYEQVNMNGFQKGMYYIQIRSGVYFYCRKVVLK